MSENITLAEIKAKIDIIQLAENYGFELKKHGNRYRAKRNLLRDEKTSSLDFFEDTQKFYDRGTATGGDVFDLVQAIENLSQNEAINKVKEMVGADTYSVTKREYTPIQTKKESKEIDFNKLKKYALKELQDNKTKKPFIYEIVKERENGFIESREHKINVGSTYSKLFETSTFDIEYKEKLDKLFSSIIGYSEFWDSPSIILTDRQNKVVDIVAYRPKSKETGEEIKGMKYYYKNQNNRGDEFVYPFEKLVNHIAKREKYIVIGEGLKNSVNALLYGVPFISLESTGNIKHINQKLLDAIKDFRNKGFGLVTAFDGDEAGEKAYNEFLSFTGFEAENLFSFDSNIDFTDYLMSSDD